MRPCVLYNHLHQSSTQRTIHSASLILLLPEYYTTRQTCICQAYLDIENAATGFLPSILACLNPLAKTSTSAISLSSGLDMATGETEGVELKGV